MAGGGKVGLKFIRSLEWLNFVTVILTLLVIKKPKKYSAGKSKAFWTFGCLSISLKSGRLWAKIEKEGSMPDLNIERYLYRKHKIIITPKANVTYEKISFHLGSDHEIYVSQKNKKKPKVALLASQFFLLSLLKYCWVIKWLRTSTSCPYEWIFINGVFVHVQFHHGFRPRLLT